MTISFTNESGVEVNIGPSDAMPGYINVTIFGPNEQSVQSAIFKLADEYGYVNFTHPARCGEQTPKPRWGAMGRVR